MGPATCQLPDQVVTADAAGCMACIASCNACDCESGTASVWAQSAQQVGTAAWQEGAGACLSLSFEKPRSRPRPTEESRSPRRGAAQTNQENVTPSNTASMCYCRFLQSRIRHFFYQNASAVRGAWPRSTSRPRKAFCMTHVRRTL